MDAVLLLTALTLLCLVLLGKYITSTIHSGNERQKKYNEIIYHEARRSSRISLQCVLEVENIAVSNKKQFTELYTRQAEILRDIKDLIGDDEFDISDENYRDKSVKELLEKVKFRQKYISDTIDRLEQKL